MKIISILMIATLALNTGFTVNPEAMLKDDESRKIEDAITVLQEINEIAEQRIPPALLKQAEGIVIIPSVIKAGFVVAGNRGKGIAMVREEDGTWSLPAFVNITGGSVGFQAGVKATDVILMFKRKQTLYEMQNRDFTLGADASIAAGPVGRTASASTNIKFEAEILSYSRSRGVFAGVSFEGSVLDVNDKANETFYWKQGVTVDDIYHKNVEEYPAEVVEKLMSTLDGVAL
jgi:lipid-binding SYLF domain-containing protein